MLQVWNYLWCNIKCPPRQEVRNDEVWGEHEDDRKWRNRHRHPSPLRKAHDLLSFVIILSLFLIHQLLILLILSFILLLFFDWLVVFPVLSQVQIRCIELVLHVNDRQRLIVVLATPVIILFFIILLWIIWRHHCSSDALLIDNESWGKALAWVCLRAAIYIHLDVLVRDWILWDYKLLGLVKVRHFVRWKLRQGLVILPGVHEEGLNSMLYSSLLDMRIVYPILILASG